LHGCNLKKNKNKSKKALSIPCLKANGKGLFWRERALHFCVWIMLCFR